MNTSKDIEVLEFQSRENLLLELEYFKYMALTYQRISDDLLEYISLTNKVYGK